MRSMADFISFQSTAYPSFLYSLPRFPSFVSQSMPTLVLGVAPIYLQYIGMLPIVDVQCTYLPNSMNCFICTYSFWCSNLPAPQHRPPDQPPPVFPQSPDRKENPHNPARRRQAAERNLHVVPTAKCSHSRYCSLAIVSNAHTPHS